MDLTSDPTPQIEQYYAPPPEEDRSPTISAPFRQSAEQKRLKPTKDESFEKEGVTFNCQRYDAQNPVKEYYLCGGLQSKIKNYEQRIAEMNKAGISVVIMELPETEKKWGILPLYLKGMKHFYLEKAKTNPDIAKTADGHSTAALGLFIIRCLHMNKLEKNFEAVRYTSMFLEKAKANEKYAPIRRKLYSAWELTEPHKPASKAVVPKIFMITKNAVGTAFSYLPEPPRVLFTKLADKIPEPYINPENTSNDFDAGDPTAHLIQELVELGWRAQLLAKVRPGKPKFTETFIMAVDDEASCPFYQQDLAELVGAKQYPILNAGHNPIIASARYARELCEAILEPLKKVPECAIAKQVLDKSRAGFFNSLASTAQDRLRSGITYTKMRTQPEGSTMHASYS